MVKAEYAEKFYEISFSDKISKQAYLKACKWLAVKVYGKEELSKYVSVKIRKMQDTQLPTFKVMLYITVSEKDQKNGYCDKCKSLHTVMYSVDKPECQLCKVEGYRKTLNNSIKNLVEFWKGMFESDEEF